MKRFLKSTVAAGLAFSLIGAPLAMAEDQHAPQGNHGAPQHTVQHAAVHHTTVQHVTIQHQTIQHQTVQHVVVQHTVVQHTVIQHNNNTNWNHPVPPQHAQYYGGGHQWHNGDRYNGNRNYVTNYNQYHLSQPPAGYQWVQDGGQFVLIAVATGVITSVILNSLTQ